MSNDWIKFHPPSDFWCLKVFRCDNELLRQSLGSVAISRSLYVRSALLFYESSFARLICELTLLNNLWDRCSDIWVLVTSSWLRDVVVPVYNLVMLECLIFLNCTALCSLVSLHELFLILIMVKYSVILPTYNERENLPIITYLIFEMARVK